MRGNLTLYSKTQRRLDRERLIRTVVTGGLNIYRITESQPKNILRSTLRLAVKIGKTTNRENE